MTTSHLKYEEPASGTGVATEAFTEDSITKHFERVIQGYQPQSSSTVHTFYDIAHTYQFAASWILSDGSTNRWTASSGDSGAYYYTGSMPANFDWDDVLIVGVEMGGAMKSEGTAGSLIDHQWSVTDQDTLGSNTLYVQMSTGDPDGQASGYIKIYYALPCAGKNIVRVQPYFGNASQTAVIVPVLYQIDDAAYPSLQDEITITELGDTVVMPNEDDLPDFVSTGFDIDVKGALYFGLAIKTRPASGLLYFSAWSV